MNQIDFDNILFRSSSFGYLMVEPTAKKKIYYAGGAEISAQKYNALIDKAVSANNIEAFKFLSTKEVATNEKIAEGTKTHLIDVYVSERYKRKEEITSKYLNKGNEREEDGITLLSRVNGVMYKKNEEHLSNDFVKGTPDLFDGKIIIQAKRIIDTKLSWSAYTFFRTQKGELVKIYYWQIMCYLWLTGAKIGTVAYCLVNGTPEAINDEKKRLAWGMKIIDGAGNPEYIKRCKQIEINHIFDIEAFVKENKNFEFHNDLNEWGYDIPYKDRVFEMDVIRDDKVIEAMQNKVIDCREWMKYNFS